MDKETLSHYGWVVILILILSVMLALTTPFGDYIGNGIVTITRGFKDVADHTIDEDSITVINNKFEDVFNEGEPILQKLQAPTLRIEQISYMQVNGKNVFALGVYLVDNATDYDIYADGKKIGTVSINGASSFNYVIRPNDRNDVIYIPLYDADMTTLINPIINDGVSIRARARAEGYEASNYSNSVSYQWEKWFDLILTYYREDDNKTPIPNTRIDIMDSTGKVVVSDITDVNGQIRCRLKQGIYTFTGANNIHDGMITIDEDGNATISYTKTFSFSFSWTTGGKPLVGTTVYLKDMSGNTVATAVTDDNGTAFFDEIPAGEYMISGNGISEFKVTVTETGEIIQEKPKFHDISFRYSGDVSNIVGNTVYLKDQSDTVIATATIQSDGSVLFEDIPSGTYTISGEGVKTQTVVVDEDGKITIS